MPAWAHTFLPGGQPQVPFNSASSQLAIALQSPSWVAALGDWDDKRREWMWDGNSICRGFCPSWADHRSQIQPDIGFLVSFTFSTTFDPASEVLQGYLQYVHYSIFAADIFAASIFAPNIFTA